MNIFLSPEMFPFSVALLVLVGLVTLQLFMFLLGADIAGMVDDLLPGTDFDLPDASGLAKALSFFGIGKVPAVVILEAFLGSFGTSGYVLQNASLVLFGSMGDAISVSAIALLMALTITGRVASLLARMLPSEESSAVGVNSLIGRHAVITYGDATNSLPASAKVTDSNGQIHHIQVKAARPEGFFAKGAEVKIVSRKDGFFFVAAD